MFEVDLVRGDSHDMYDDQKWEEIAERIRQGDWDAIIMSPPCSTWSRAVWSNKLGPRPVRSRDFPHGFPWLVGELKEKADIGTTLVMRCIEVLEIAPSATVCVWERPEDLGRARNGVPANIWQLDQLRSAAKKRGMDTIVFHQCTYGANYPKPTRLLSDADGLLQKGHPGWPTFNEEGYYLGPLPRNCGHQHPPLIRSNPQLVKEALKTGPTAAYPVAMNQMLAELVFNHWLNRTLTPAEGGLEGSPAGSGHQNGSQKETPQERQVTQDPSLELAQPGEKGQRTSGYAMRGQGGKRFHDGAGLCSQGNIGGRPSGTSPSWPHWGKSS